MNETPHKSGIRLTDKNSGEAIELENHNKILPLEWSRGVFLNLLVEKTKAISHLAVLVELVLGKRDTFSVNL